MEIINDYRISTLLNRIRAGKYTYGSGIMVNLNHSSMALMTVLSSNGNITDIRLNIFSSEENFVYCSKSSFKNGLQEFDEESADL